eukprot:CAMPEP_0198341670 /NCGR_PEP_ID=MMETSP1450-20131203/49036_1 /TAXON_ID=753684 ORGANISM="Madagascaria erythrocladiodes, Strain CCMP3234" /NCGR_SAMPLE_ID=MMETSP1450 /ASSEMBLY_ACC=CAM_ASM_001115 /LENGTH=205 /DNA_ID=CAMNT_0044046721 /DNA_START=59 /DNA_END=676 /DNA_ORIENTATION=+
MTNYVTSSGEHPRPPWADDVPPPAHAEPVRRFGATTLYDWTRMAMVEKYDGTCIGIFDHPPLFSCTFLNVHNRTWLISESPRLGPCCKFGDPWHPPSPDFLKVADFVGEYKAADGRRLQYWQYGGDEQFPGGNFLYAVQFDKQSGAALPARFVFPTIMPLGWTAQQLDVVSLDAPPADTWRVPDVCADAPECGIVRHAAPHRVGA